MKTITMAGKGSTGQTSAEYNRLRAIVCNGSPEELRQALPSDKWKRKAAVCKLDEELGLSLLFDACWWGRWDMAAALADPFTAFFAHAAFVNVPLPLLSAPLLSALWPARAAAAPEEDAPPAEDEASGTAESIVVTAPDGTPRVAGSAHVVSEAELERFEYTDIHKVLAKIPGVTIRVEDGFGLRPNIGIRGVDSDRSSKILLLEDGLPLAPAPYAAPAAYYFPLTQRVVGVEVFKGATAIRQGPQTIAGAINLLTRPVGPRDAAALDLAVGPRDTQKLHGWVNMRTGDLGLLLDEP
jgi:Fe(3+) dicitrate transport protein